MIETSAAQRRIDRQDELTLTAAWLTASLQRAKKIPSLKKLLAKPGDKTDIGLYLAGVRESLPKVRMSDVLKAGPRTQPPE